AVARERHQGGEEPAELVTAQEQFRAAPLGQVLDVLGDVYQRVHIGLEELIARVVLQDRQQVLPGVAVRREPGAGEYGTDLVADDGQPQHRFGIGGGGEHAQEAAFPSDVALRIEGAHADVVQVDRAVHGGPRVRLGDGQ